MSYFAFVRHGLSQANVDRIVAGQFDTPLAEKGRQQARDTASLLKDIAFHHVHGSPLRRAKETLEIILEELQQDVIPTFHDELQERNWGDVEQTGWKTRGDGKYSPEEADLWLTWSGCAPGGESYEDMSNRIVPFFDKYILPRLKAGENVLVVSHNGVSKPLQRHLGNLPHESTHTLDLKNCEVKLYEFDEDGKVQNVESRVPQENQ